MAKELSQGNELLEGALRQTMGPPTFYLAVQEWSQGNERLRTRLQQMLSNSSEDGKIDDVIELTKAYQKHKVDYMKHISFNPEGENLSKYIFDDGMVIVFSFCAGSHPTGGSIHLL